MTVASLALRGILDSRAQVTVEAELALASGHRGMGSAPRAIAPGRLERTRGPRRRLGPFAVPELAARLLAAGELDQLGCDTLLAQAHGAGLVGSDVTLAVSLAFARAAAAASGARLHDFLSSQAGTTPGLPRLLVNVFSGGIHRAPESGGFQQVMVLPQTGSLTGDIELALQVFGAAEKLAAGRFGAVSLSASSGLLVPLGSVEQLELLEAALAAADTGDRCTIGVDVAAEHLLAQSGRYRFGGQEWDREGFAGLLAKLAVGHRISFLEDPFDAAHQDEWRWLRAALPDFTVLVGDDLFATDATRIERGLADGILLKPSQAGTISGTLAAAEAARGVGMLLAVSHRSGETEDTAMVDLAVALSAELIKIGGPRRGDRLAKYNNLLRLAEAVPAGQPTASSRTNRTQEKDHDRH